MAKSREQSALPEGVEEEKEEYKKLRQRVSDFYKEFEEFLKTENKFTRDNPKANDLYNKVKDLVRDISNENLQNTDFFSKAVYILEDYFSVFSKEEMWESYP